MKNPLVFHKPAARNPDKKKWEALDDIQFIETTPEAYDGPLNSFLNDEIFTQQSYENGPIQPKNSRH